MTQIYNEKLFTTLLSQRITEKGTFLEKDRQYTFRVKKEATKIAIKKAVEAVFNVAVDSVRVCNVQGKEKRVGKTLGRRKNWKKAYVMLKEGHSINRDL